VLTAAWVTTEPEEIDRRVSVRMRRQELITDPHGPKLILTPGTWQAFTTALQTGQLHLG
jgi:hypothetical protein